MLRARNGARAAKAPIRNDAPDTRTSPARDEKTLRAVALRVSTKDFKRMELRERARSSRGPTCVPRGPPAGTPRDSSLALDLSLALQAPSSSSLFDSPFPSSSSNSHTRSLTLAHPDAWVTRGPIATANARLTIHLAMTVLCSRSCAQSSPVTRKRTSLAVIRITLTTRHVRVAAEIEVA